MQRVDFNSCLGEQWVRSLALAGPTLAPEVSPAPPSPFLVTLRFTHLPNWVNTPLWVSLSLLILHFPVLTLKVLCSDGEQLQRMTHAARLSSSCQSLSLSLSLSLTHTHTHTHTHVCADTQTYSLGGKKITDLFTPTQDSLIVTRSLLLLWTLHTLPPPPPPPPLIPVII